MPLNPNSFLGALAEFEFDIAIFAEHARDDGQGDHQLLSCPQLVFRRDGSPIRWPRRWSPMGPEAECWIHGQTPWIDNLKQPSDPDLKELLSPAKSPGVRILLGFDILSVITFAINDGDHLAASISLGSKTQAAFGASEYERLAAGAIRTRDARSAWAET